MNNEFTLERFRYILDQKKNINNNTFKIVAFYQAFALAIGGAQFSIFRYVFDKSINLQIAQSASFALFIISCLISFFSVLLIICGIASWINYREEEHEIDSKFGKSMRDLPGKWSWLKWYESYIVIAILFSQVAYGFGLRLFIIPTLSSRTFF